MFTIIFTRLRYHNANKLYVEGNVLNSLRLSQRLAVFVIRTAAVDLAHKVHGGNPSPAAILVLHGLLGSKRSWDSMCKKIQQAVSKPVVAVDARNHGDSPHVSTHTYPELAEDVSKLIKKLNIAEPMVIGHSMGGRTGMVLALTQPTKVKKLVVVDVSPVSTPGILNDFFPRLIESMLKVIFDPGDNLSSSRSKARDQIMATGIVDDPRALDFILLNIGQREDKTIGWKINVSALKNNFHNISTFPPELLTKAHPGPTLFLAGQNSNYVPPSDITGIQRMFPQAQLKYIPNVGHNVHAEDPNNFLNIVTKFLIEN